MVEVVEDNKKQEKRGKKSEKKERICKKRRRKSPNIGIEHTTTYYAAHVSSIELRLHIYNCYCKSDVTVAALTLPIIAFMSQAHEVKGSHN